MSPELKAILDKYSPFFAEARRRIVFTVIVFVAASFLGFFSYEQIIKFLIQLLGLTGINIVFTSPFQFINLAISCGLATGIVVSLPLLVTQILSFLRPALSKNEYKTIVGFLPFSLILFIVGFIAGAYLMKWQIEIFLASSLSIGIGNVLDISRLLTTVLLTSVLMGTGFQFPIVLLLLLRVGVINQEQLSKKRKWVYLASLMFAVLLPVDSILADILLALPLIFLFELTLILNSTLEKKKVVVV
jgi:sec-independent protein translocase protein TatC